MKHLVWLGLTAWIIGAGGIVSAADESPKEAARENALGRRLIELFDGGFQRGSKSLPEAQRRYEQLRSESKNDPRVDYSYGLVLLRQLRNKEAQAQFLLATKRPGAPYWPAWQALIWTHGVSKEMTLAYERLTELAKQLVKVEDAAEDDTVAEIVDWIGQSMAAFEKMADSPKSRDAWLREDETLRELFQGKLIETYNTGHEDVHARHALLEDDIRITREKTLEKRERERIDKQTQIGKDLESAGEKKESLKKSADEMKKAFDDQLLNFDKQLSRLERDYGFLEKRAASIIESQLQLDREMSLLQTRATTNTNSNAPASRTINGQSNYEAQMQNLQGQKFKYQAEYDQTLGAAQQVTQRAQVLIQQRTAAVLQYQKASGQIVQQDAKLDKWQDRLKKDGQKLKEPSSDKVAAVTGKINQVRSFRTYIELDVIEQRDRVLDSFGVAMPDKADAK